MNTIAILGATGLQGNSVVQALLKNGTWRIRGITRNTESEAAKRLAKQVRTKYSTNNKCTDQDRRAVKW
jgi:uncharacterized protein YbjT (DUF2867 family)